MNWLESYIRQAAQARGIDPAIALKVARSEGLAPGVWQSNVMSRGRREPSYGPFQLLVGGPGTGFPRGLGNKFIETTGLDPRDPETVKAQVDFALDEVRTGGWSPWMGAKKLGITGFHGINRDAPVMAMNASYPGVVGQGSTRPLGHADLWQYKHKTDDPTWGTTTGILGTQAVADPQRGLRGSPERPSVPFQEPMKEWLTEPAVLPGEDTMSTYQPTGVLSGPPAKPNRFREWLGDNRGFLLGLGAELLAHGIDTRNPVTGAGIMAGANADERRQDRRADRDKEMRGQNATLRLLMQRGYSETEAMDLIHSGLAIKALSPGFRDGGTSYGKSPVYGTDEQGNPVLGTVGDDGSFKVLETPGFTPSTGVDKIDAGTHWILQDKRSGQMVGTIPKENYQEAFDTAQGRAEGESQGKAVANIGKAQEQARNMLALVQDLKTDKDRKIGTGLTSLGNVIPASPGFDYNQKIKQIQGQAFLQAFESLKGGGHITEIEGQKATEAIARLDPRQSEEAFLKALSDLEEVITSGLRRMESRVGASPMTMPQAPPSSGEVIDYQDWLNQ